MIKFVSDLRQAGVFFSCTPVSSTKKTDRHDIAEILLKVALNIINLIQIYLSKLFSFAVWRILEVMV